MNKKNCLVILSIVSLLVGCRFRGVYDDETNLDAVKRIMFWGVNIPSEIEVLTRNYSYDKTPEWDVGFNCIYHVFQSKANFIIEDYSKCNNIDSFQNMWSNYQDNKDLFKKERDYPDFQSEYDYYYLVLWGKKNYDENRQYYYDYFIESLEIARYISDNERNNHYQYWANCYLLYQKETNLLYSLFVVDASECVDVIKIENISKD